MFTYLKNLQVSFILTRRTFQRTFVQVFEEFIVVIDNSMLIFYSAKRIKKCKTTSKKSRISITACDKINQI